MKINGMTLGEIADMARASNPELGAIGNQLVNYYTGRVNATFEDHEGEGAEDTALFLASARQLVIDLVRELNRYQEAQEIAQNVPEVGSLMMGCQCDNAEFADDSLTCKNCGKYLF